MKALTIGLLAVLLSGCGAKYNYSVEAAVNKMPESVRQKCEPIDKKLVKKEGEVDSVPMGDLLKAKDYLVGLYGECAERDAAKADWIASQGQ